MREGGALGWRDWRELVTTYLLPHRSRVAALGALLAVSIALQVTAPLLVKAFIDRAISPARRPLGALAFTYVGAVLLQQAARIAVAWLGEIVGWVTTNRLRTDLLGHCLDLDPSFHVTHTPGELIERVDGDVSGLSVFFAHFLLEVVGNLLLLAGILGVVWWQDVLGGFVLTLLAGFAVTTLLLVRRVGARHWVVAREASARLFGFLE